MADRLPPDPELEAELLELLATYQAERAGAPPDPRVEALSALAGELVDQELDPYRKHVSVEKLADLRGDTIQWVLLGPLRERLDLALVPNQISEVVRKDGKPVGSDGQSGAAGGEGA